MLTLCTDVCGVDSLNSSDAFAVDSVTNAQKVDWRRNLGVFVIILLMLLISFTFLSVLLASSLWNFKLLWPSFVMEASPCCCCILFDFVEFADTCRAENTSLLLYPYSIKMDLNSSNSHFVLLINAFRCLQVIIFLSPLNAI